MASFRPTPVIIGVGDIKNKSEDALEPLDLIFRAIRLAIADTGMSGFFSTELQSSIDSIDVVATWTWPYPDLPSLLASKLGVRPHHKHYTEHGGNQPAKLIDDAARRISLGESKVAVVTGGEALASLSASMSSTGAPPPHWTPLPTGAPGRVLDLSRVANAIGAIHKIGLPIHVYPLYENAFRAYRGQSLEENHRESARLYAEFARVAEGNELAWTFGERARTEEEIASVGGRNRMICVPYPLLMNAFNNVNLAAAVLLTSTEFARELGIPESKWIYPLGGAGTRDSYEFWQRPNYHSSPAVSRSLDTGLEASGLRKDDVDLFDFYSCFPVVPKLACHHFDLPITNQLKTITLLGGLTSFGGAGNNYSMHAITEMTRRLRARKGKTGLVLANGGVMTYQHVICLSSSPRLDGSPYPEKPPLPDVVYDVPVPAVDAEVDGEAVIETYTVEFNRDDTPLLGHIVGRLKSTNHRFLANHGDASTLKELASGVREPVGRSGWVHCEKGTRRNLFSFESGARI